MTWLEDTCAELEEGHDDTVEQKLKVDRLLPHEVHQHRLFNNKKQNTLDLLNTKRKKKVKSHTLKSYLRFSACVFVCFGRWERVILEFF